MADEFKISHATIGLVITITPRSAIGLVCCSWVRSAICSIAAVLSSASRCYLHATNIIDLPVERNQRDAKKTA